MTNDTGSTPTPTAIVSAPAASVRSRPERINTKNCAKCWGTSASATAISSDYKSAQSASSFASGVLMVVSESSSSRIMTCWSRIHLYHSDCWSFFTGSSRLSARCLMKTKLNITSLLHTFVSNMASTYALCSKSQFGAGCVWSLC